MAICQVDDIRGVLYAEATLGSWGLGLITAALVVAWQATGGSAAYRARMPHPQSDAPAGPDRTINLWIAAGLGLMSIPAWFAVLATAPDIVRTFCAQGDLNLVIIPGQTVPSASRYALSGQYIEAILRELGYVAAGGVLYWRGRDPQWRSPTIPRLAQAIGHLIPMRGGEGRSLALGVALFPLLVVANLILLSLIPKTGNDSRVFANLSGIQIVLLALAAGVGEELVYRGVMQQGVRRLFSRKWVGLTIAILVQAIVFAYAHTGYKDLQHLQFAFYFAIVAAIAVQWLGMWAAIALHVLIDFFAFAGSAANPGPLFDALYWAVAAAVVATSITYAYAAIRGRARTN